MKQLLGLLQIKKIIALALTLVFVVLSLKGSVSSDQFLSVFLVIVGFYYGQSTAKSAKIGE